MFPRDDGDTEAVDSLKVLDPNRPIREATELSRRRETTQRATSGLMRCSKLGEIQWDNSANGRDNAGS
jgi:hypothetical protein